MAYLIIILALGVLFLKGVPTNCHVIDGDTIVIKGKKWRLSGFDAPEMSQPGGRQARSKLQDILRKRLSLGIVTGRDVYGRGVMKVITLKGPLSWRMCLAGWAHPAGMITSILFLFARLNKRGVWSLNERVIKPAYWREMHGMTYTVTRKIYVKKVRLPRVFGKGGFLS
jgi:endonuclease YncB( thermonuclease family)